MKWENELALAQRVARVAGNLLVNDRKIIAKIQSKFDKDIKLVADKQSEDTIFGILTKESRLPILSEERGMSREFVIDSDCLFWIVDPLDGSMNYYQNIPLACVSIALWKGNQPILGVIYDFYRNEIFSRICGEQLGINGMIFERNKESKLEADSIIATGFPSGRSYDSDSLLEFVKKVQKYKKVRLLGSAALSLAWVACGRIDVYSEEDIYLWDVAAGLALIDKDKYNLSNKHGTEYKLNVIARAQ